MEKPAHNNQNTTIPLASDLYLQTYYMHIHSP